MILISCCQKMRTARARAEKKIETCAIVIVKRICNTFIRAFCLISKLVICETEADCRRPSCHLSDIEEIKMIK